MSVSISNKQSDKKITFNKKSLFFKTNIQINSGSSTTLNVDNIGKKCKYLKILANVSPSSTDVYTNNGHNVAVVYEITYIDDDNNETVVPYAFYPRYQHEVNNKNTTDIIDTDSTKIKSIVIKIYNNETNCGYITIDKIAVYYSLFIDEETVEEKVNEGIAGGGGEVPTSNVFTIYNVENNFTIDGYGKSLTLDVNVPDDILQKYYYTSASYKYIDLVWELSAESGSPTYSVSYDTKQKILTDAEGNNDVYTIKYGKIKILSNGSYNAGDGVIKIIVRLNGHEEIYGTAYVEIKNNAVTEIYLKSISSSDEKLHTDDDVTIDIGFRPEKSSCDISGKFILQSYDNEGGAKNVYGYDSYTSNGSLGSSFTIRGKSAGKVSLYLGNDSVHKQFIFDVINDSGGSDSNIVAWPKFPDSNSYFCIFREGARSNRIEMGTFNCSSSAGITASANGSKNPLNVNNLSGSVTQYYLDTTNNVWVKSGTYTRISDNATELLYYNVELTNTSNISDGTKVSSYDVLLKVERPES